MDVIKGVTNLGGAYIRKRYRAAAPRRLPARVGQKITLLGFFSVNLKKALEGSEGATSEGDAVAVKDAVEFFVFGKAVNQAVQTCGGH